VISLDIYSDNKLISSKRFYDNGQLRREAQYENYSLSGKEKTYYYGGQLFKEGEYQDMKPHGMTTFYNKQGDVDCQIKFEQGKAVQVEVKNENYSNMMSLRE